MWTFSGATMIRGHHSEATDLGIGGSVTVKFLSIQCAHVLEVHHRQFDGI
jgi:hypothetical protein